MKIIENPEIERYILDRLKSVRSDKSIHVTDLIYCLRKAWYRIKGYDANIPDEAVMATGLGRGLHEVFETSPFKEVQVERDGIVGSIDMIADTITEIKTTRFRLDIRENWIRQIKAYLAMYGGREADLLVVDVAGNRVKGYRLIFTDEEIDEWWRWMLDRKKRLEEHLTKDEPPPQEPEYKWECNGCPYRAVCKGEQPEVDFTLLWWFG